MLKPVVVRVLELLPIRRRMYRYRIPGIPTPSKQASRHFLRLPFAFRLQSLPAKSFASLNLDFGGKFPPLTLASLTSHYNNNISRERVILTTTAPPPAPRPQQQHDHDIRRLRRCLSAAVFPPCILPLRSELAIISSCHK